MLKKFNKIIEQTLNEAVVVLDNRYLHSHNKNPSGTGTWIFTNKASGDVDFNDPSEIFTINTSYNKAKTAAKKWGKENGYGSVYVMEQNI